MSADATVPPDAVGTGGLQQRRRIAVAEAIDEAFVSARSGRPVVAVRRFGDGALVIAPGGHIENATVRHLDAVLRDVHRLASRHLVIDLTAVRSSDLRLARVLARVRIRGLLDDTDLTVHNLPDELRDEYGHQIGHPTDALPPDA